MLQMMRIIVVFEIDRYGVVAHLQKLVGSRKRVDEIRRTAFDAIPQAVKRLEAWRGRKIPEETISYCDIDSLVNPGAQLTVDPCACRD